MASRLRCASAAAGLAVILGAYAFGLRDPLASMTVYTVALMTLNQLAPPLLLAALPPRRLRRTWASDLFLDPVTALVGFIALSVAVSLPSVLDPSLANTLFAAPVGLLELATGVMIWGQMLPATRLLRRGWQVAALELASPSRTARRRTAESVRRLPISRPDANRRDSPGAGLVVTRAALDLNRPRRRRIGILDNQRLIDAQLRGVEREGRQGHCRRSSQCAEAGRNDRRYGIPLLDLASSTR